MKESKPNISIVVPVYNVEKYLVRCLDSIFTQQFSGTFEVIAVEDASTDSSLEILKKYQEKETQLKIIEHGFNKKLSVVRATGMKAASGDYIMHVDSDDWLLPGSLESLFAICLKSNADVVVFNYVTEDNNGKRILVNNIKNQIVTIDKFKVQHHFFGAPWNKIVKRHLTENMISGQIGVNNTEDLLYATEILLRAKEICLTPQNYYTYFVNSVSLSQYTGPEQYLQNQVLILSQIQKIFSQYKESSRLISNAVNYFAKYIYYNTAKIQFINKQKIIKNKNLIQEFAPFDIFGKKRIRQLENALNNKIICLIHVTKYFGIKTSLWLVIRNFRKIQ